MTPRRAKTEGETIMARSSLNPISVGGSNGLSCLPLVEELTPAPDPWRVFERAWSLPHAVFLDSSAADPLLGRHSFITADPFEWLCRRGTFLNGASDSQKQSNPFDELAKRLERYEADSLEGLPPFQGGAAGLFGYDLCHCLERLPRPRFDEFRIPHMAVGIYDWVISFDHRTQRAWLVSTGFPGTDPRRRHRRAARRLKAVKRLIRSGESDLAGARCAVHTSDTPGSGACPRGGRFSRLGQ